MRLKHFIDSHKGITGLAVLAMIAGYGAWENPVAWLYLALHGTYGILWITKSRFFADAHWERPSSLGFGLLIWGGLSLYWVGPWLITSGRSPTPPAWYLGLCVALYSVGVFLHFAADMQKHTSLRLRPGVLITEGLWSVVRNPNYLGELFIYTGFCALAMHPAPFLTLALFLFGYWLPNMRKKDHSLSRYPGFADYKAKTWLFLPGIW
jgi:protein-S-isoprenylcysteine O-methyltransferase Ste14